MNISTIIKERIDQNDIQDNLISREAIEILNIVSSEISENPFKIREIILSHFPPKEILRSKKLRELVLLYLVETEVMELLKALNVEAGKNNPYKQLLKIRFRKNSTQEKTLFKFFGVDTSTNDDDTTASKHKDEEIVNVERQMFQHQRLAIAKIGKLLSSGKRKCLLHMPTGSGKTITAMRTVSSMFLESNPTMVVWLAYNEELCEQAIEEFKKTWASMGDRHIRLFRYFSSYASNIIAKTSQCKEGIIFASLAKLNRAEQKGDVFLSTLSDRVNMVVMDEAHQAIAPTYMNILQQLVEKRVGTTKLLGLSATPGRASLDIQESVKLAKFFNRKKVTLEIEGYENPTEYLIDNGYLAKPHSVSIQADGNLNADDLNRIAKAPIDIPEEILIKMGKSVKRTVTVINEIEKLVNSGHKRLIVFGASVKNSRDINMILNVMGHRSFHVDRETSLESRSKYVTEYRADIDKVMIMCNYGVFTTGFDAPKTSAVVIARPTRSIILYSQMAGRAMRGEKVGGNKKCEIITITDINLPQFTELVQGFFTWEDMW